MALTNKEILYDITIANPLALTNEPIVCTDIATPVFVGDNKRAFLYRSTTDVTITTSTGIAIYYGTDYTLVQTPTDLKYSKQYNTSIYSEIIFKNPGNYLINYLCCGSYVKASLINYVQLQIKNLLGLTTTQATTLTDHETRIITLEAVDDTVIPSIIAKNEEQDDDIAALETIVSGHTTTIGLHTTQIATATSVNDSQNTQLAAQTTSISAINTDLLGVHSDIDTINETLDAITGGGGSQLGELDARVTTLESNELVINSRLGAVETQNTNQDATLLQNTTDISTINITLESVNDHLDTIDTTNTQQNTNIATVTNDLMDHAADTQVHVSTAEKNVIVQLGETAGNPTWNSSAWPVSAHTQDWSTVTNIPPAVNNTLEQGSVLDPWMYSLDTWTYASATSFSITGDRTNIFQAGVRIKLTQTTVKYFIVTGVSYSSPTTTVILSGGGTYSLADEAITIPAFSYAYAPISFPLDTFNANNVAGPATSTINNIAVFADATGKVLADGGTTISALSTTILNLVYPIGSFYVQYPDADSNTDSTAFPTSYSPAVLWGGTWSAQWNSEAVFFCTGPNGTDEEQTRTNGLQQDQMMYHKHTQELWSAPSGSNSGYVGQGSGSPNAFITNPRDTSIPISDGTHGTPNLGTTNKPRNRLIKIWKRTA